MQVATTAALLLASAQAPLGSTLIAVALPSISLGTGVDLVLLTSLLVTGYLIVNVVSQGPAGSICDIVGHARMLWAGIWLYVVGALCGLVAPGVVLLVVSRCLMAMAGAMVVPATLALLRINTPATSRGRIFGLFGATMGLAAAGGPALGGEIVSLFGWREIFVVSLPFLGLAAILLRIHPPPSEAGERVRPAPGVILRSVDFVGVGLLALSLTFLILASKAIGAGMAGMLLGALALGMVFLAWEMRAARPVFDPRLFANSAFATGTAITALQNFAMYGLLFELPQFFSVFRHAPPRSIGLMLFVMMLGMVIAAPAGGQLTDRVGARLAALAGSVLLLAGIVMLWPLGASFAHPSDALVPLLSFGVGMGLSSAPAQSAAMSAVEPERAGMAAGINSTMRYMGAILSILVLGAVLGNDTAVSIQRHEVMIRLFTVAVVLAMGASLRLPGSHDFPATRAGRRAPAGATRKDGAG